VPKSPRWLILFKNDIDSARKILTLIYDKKEIQNKIEEIQNSINNKKSENLFSGVFNHQIKLAFLLAFFNQLSGINFVLYYAPEILQTAGFATSDSLMSSVSIGFVNLIFTLVGLRLIDNYGRKNLMLIGSIGYIISLFTIAICFIYQLDPFVLLFFILIFISSHAIGQGTVIWVFISEIFPNHMRARGQSFGTGVHWIFAALITAVTPTVINILGNNPGMVFYGFGIMMILQLIFVIKMMPETKGISLEKINF
jgi:MFS family permease